MKRHSCKCGILVVGLALALSGGAIALPAPQSSQQNQNQDITMQEVAAFDQFLDQHPDIGKQVRNNPSLINDQEFLENHTQLQAFLNDHPNLKEEFTENPALFMRREGRFEGSARDQGVTPNPAGNPDLKQGQLASFDHFLDQHPDIAKQLQKNPSLIGNQEFLENNTQLQAFLNDHPNLKEEFRENPALFMRREGRFEDSARDQDVAPNPAGNPDLKQGQLASFDRFLDQHPDIAKQLQKNPSLIGNQEFLENHTQLLAFLNDHPNLKEEFRENPALFMRREGRFEDSARDQDVTPKPAGNPDLTRGQVAAFDQFLDKHPKVADQLEDNPSLVNDKGFLKKNHDLANFLKDHKGIREELAENPSQFMRREQRLESGDRDMAKANPDLTDKQLATLDKFLDKHPKIGDQLEDNPNLINDKSFLKKNHELADFLKDHKELREELKENPSLAMQREARLDEQRAAMRDKDRHHRQDADRRARQSREERARLEREKERFKH